MKWKETMRKLKRGGRMKSELTLAEASSSCEQSRIIFFLNLQFVPQNNLQEGLHIFLSL